MAVATMYFAAFAAATLAFPTPHAALNNTTGVGLSLLQLHADSVEKRISGIPNTFHHSKKVKVSANTGVYLPDLGSNDCSKCAFMGDLRCHTTSTMMQYFYRINNCLWPLYDVVRAARSEPRNGLSCFITDPHIQSFVLPLTGDMKRRIISPTAQCIHRTKVNESRFIGGIGHDYSNMKLVERPSDEQMENLRLNRAALGRDARQVGTHHPNLKNKLLGPGRGISGKLLSPRKGSFGRHGSQNTRYVILIIRKDGRREFLNESEEMLKHNLKELGKRRGFKLVTYDGGSSESDTIKLFAHAAGVVGYHGAGFANVLFSYNTCVVEMSVYKDADYSDKTVGRVMNMNQGIYRQELDKEPAWKRWAIVPLPLRDQMIANMNIYNGIREEDSATYVDSHHLWDEEYLTERTKRVNVTRNNVQKVVRELRSCL